MNIFNIPKKVFLPLTRLLKSNKLDDVLFKSDLKINSEEYLSLGIFYSIIGFFFILIIVHSILLVAGIQETINIALITAGIAFFVGILLLIITPFYLITRKQYAIDRDLPLAILSMATIGQAGVAPQYIFESIAKEREYAIIGRELGKINNYVNSLKISLSEAIQILIEKSVSKQLNQFLSELKSVIESGGDLTLFLLKKSEAVEFEYNIKIQEESKRAELFGDIYTALVIAGPLFIFATVMLLSMFTTKTTFVDLNFMLMFGIFGLVPAINIIFMLLMEIMSPS